jgi:endonuclease/exonuclease/phosphatase (EEP) superfamily protein YafD
VAWAVVRTFGLDRGHPLVAMMAFTPQVAAVSWLPVLVAAVLRRWLVAAVALAAAIALAATVLPRALPGPRPEVRDGVPLRVMVSNLRFGEGDPGTVVGLVRRERIDVLALVEVTPEAVAALDRLGLRALLPHRVDNSRPGASGTALFSRLPLRSRVALPVDAPNAQSAARLRLPGAPPLEVEAVHPLPPLHADVASWRHVLQGVPRPSSGRVLRLLLGDFNATLDQHDFRALLGTGYVDAGDATGEGLRTTWPAGRRFPPELVIDHVLVDRRIAPRTLSVHLVPHSDHRAVIADLDIPRVGGSAP